MPYKFVPRDVEVLKADGPSRTLGNLALRMATQHSTLSRDLSDCANQTSCCHLNIVHALAEISRELRAEAQDVRSFSISYVTEDKPDVLAMILIYNPIADRGFLTGFAPEWSMYGNYSNSDLHRNMVQGLPPAAETARPRGGQEVLFFDPNWQQQITEDARKLVKAGFETLEKSPTINSLMLDIQHFAETHPELRKALLIQLHEQVGRLIRDLDTQS